MKLPGPSPEVIEAWRISHTKVVKKLTATATRKPRHSRTPSCKPLSVWILLGVNLIPKRMKQFTLRLAECWDRNRFEQIDRTQDSQAVIANVWTDNRSSGHSGSGGGGAVISMPILQLAKATHIVRRT
jgi:hypothetical protein